MVFKLRKPFQGVVNIIRFNWHLYIISLAILLIIGLFLRQFDGIIHLILFTLSVGILANTLISLAVSYFVYDYSSLYTFDWLKRLPILPGNTLVNIHAGFDESSLTIKNNYVENALRILDFYDPKLHTEVSIKRARAAYPALPETESITTSQLPLPNQSADFVFLILAAHEIRSPKERLIFFQELKRILTPDGKVILLEHQRDIYNFMAYSIGFFHFYPSSTWKKLFKESHFAIQEQFKITPFITAYILQ